MEKSPASRLAAKSTSEVAQTLLGVVVPMNAKSHSGNPGPFNRKVVTDPEPNYNSPKAYFAEQRRLPRGTIQSLREKEVVARDLCLGLDTRVWRLSTRPAVA